MQTTIKWDTKNPKAVKMLAKYLAICCTDGKLAKYFKETTRREMLGDTKDGSLDFEFLVNGGIAFNKFYKLSKAE